MANLRIRHKGRQVGVALPYQVYINDIFVGMMTKQEVCLRLPQGRYKLTIVVGGRVPIGKKGRVLDLTLSSTKEVDLSDTQETVLVFKNKERWWDILFSIDLMLWFVTCFMTIPSPWNIVYHFISDGFFIIWLIRLFLVRRKYFVMTLNRELL